MLTELVFVGDRCCDHSASSGYDQLCAVFPDAGWLSERALAAGEERWHRLPASLVLPTRPLFHIIYGDFSPAPALLRQRFPDAAIIATLHRPIARVLADKAGREVVRSADLLITVSATQVAALARAGTPVGGPVQVVPHGVRFAAFASSTYDNEGVPKDGILLVGNHLRDWDLAIRVVESLAEIGITSTVLGAQDAVARVQLQPIARVLPRVPEATLVRLYREAGALFLPVRDATASNALLEAMAAGCPIVCPDLPSLVDEYLGDRFDTFPTGRADLAIDRLVNYVTDSRARESRSAVLMARAASLDWTRLRDRYLDIYRAAASCRRNIVK